MAAAERASILERVGSALNSSDLSPDAERSRPIDLIGALAMVQINASGIDHAEREACVVDPNTELGAVLVRLKYAGDHGLQDRALRLLVLWISHQKAYSRWKVKPGSHNLIDRFASQGLDEWLDDTCHACHGRRMLGIERDVLRERRIRCAGCKGQGRIGVRSKRKNVIVIQHDACMGRGWLTKSRLQQENPRPCSLCSGTGRRIASDAERARSLGLPIPVYAKHWPKRFSWLESAFDRLNTLEKNCLRASLTQG